MASGSSSSSPEAISSEWQKIVLGYYPKALSRTYMVPPVHFNRVRYDADTWPGTRQMVLRQSPNKLTGASRTGQQQAAARPKGGRGKASQQNPPPPPPPSLSPPQVLWSQEAPGRLKNVQDSDTWDDAAQARIAQNLDELGKHRREVMFVLSQYNLQGYLSKAPSQVAASQLPRPSDLNNSGVNYSQGDLDVAVIHRHRGILIGEVKSVGHTHADPRLTAAESDAEVTKKVEQAVRQLDRLEKVVKHLVKDIKPPLPVRTALFLPNVKRSQLQRVLAAAQPQLQQDVRRKLEVTTDAEAAKVCCCEDDVSDRVSWWDVTPAVLTELSRWWEDRMDSADPFISDSVYLDVVARFVGPASSIRVYCPSTPRVTCPLTPPVEVRTEGEAVAELGRRLSWLVLTPEQHTLVSQRLPLVYLTGPPGTGKTVVLVMTGVGWLEKNIDTYVVSTHSGTLAISTMICEQLKKTAAPPTSAAPVGTVHLKSYYFDDDSTALATAVRDLKLAAQGGARILMDEANFNDRRERGRNIRSLVDQLIASVPGLHFWCAGLFQDGRPPRELQTQTLTTPLRSAPVILREVQPALGRNTAGIIGYRHNGVPAPGDGQRVRHLRHEGGDHAGRWPVDCLQCGKDVAAELSELGVHVPGNGLTYRDIFILTRSSELHDQEENGGVVTSEASGIVRGVREAGMPVRALGDAEFRTDRARWERELKDVATAASDRITAAHLRFVYGLERRVVVWLPGRRQGDDDQRQAEAVDDSDRLHLVTRCTTQLIVIEVPP